MTTPIGGRAERWWADERAFDREIVVPFPPESAVSGIHDPDHPVVWYRRVAVPAARDGGGVLLHFGAVDYRAHVWVNGHPSASTRAGTPRSPPTSPRRCTEGDAVVVVRAETWYDDISQPRGKQDWHESRTPSGTTGPPGSGSPCGWSGSPRPPRRPALDA